MVEALPRIGIDVAGDDVLQDLEKVVVAVGDDGRRWFSADGGSWTETGPLGDKLVGVVWTGTAFVTGGIGQSWSSVAGMSWQALEVVPLDDLTVFEGDVFAVYADEVLRSGDDGLTWQTERVVEGLGDGLSGMARGVP